MAAPYPERVTTTDYPRAGLDLGTLRDVASLALLILGLLTLLGGLGVAAFRWDVLAGIIYVGAITTAAGLALGYRR